MTKIAEIFQRDIKRSIDGVIKADDNTGLKSEIEEYVVTNEIASNFAKFFDEYNNYTTKNGVWISGFFGSGKSHLLKMLSLIVDDAEIDSSSTAEIFRRKCSEQDTFLAAEIERAASKPSKSILFNIDQKAAIIANNDVDKLLTVFQSVLDESCGYYKEGYIAKLERDLDEKGLYEKFKEEFKKATPDNLSWAQGREEALFQSEAINAAFKAVTGQTQVSDVHEHYSQNYKVSVEDFAKQVKSHIDKQEKGFRFNFFVDEIGQFIAENTKLMLNLQTIAESLNTICKGQSWIIVTAQEALEDVVGDMSAKQTNDFSKIQARFGIRLPLTSRNVEEVIQKRLLEKKHQSENQLKLIYDNENSNFGTLFNFADGSVSLKHFSDEKHFIDSYPFVPYQYTLFREAIKGLSEHNAFEGRHSSVGERSLLGVFRDVAITISERDVGTLAPFDMMYAGISSVLKSFIQSSIQVAESNLDNEFAVRVLKALFLVKYYNQFKPSLHNISVLMLESFDQDISKLRDKIREALQLLEQQTYIQRNGEFYEFLTKEEQDIETEIKSTEIDTSELSSALHELVFQNILQSPKIRYVALNIDYKYASKIDGEQKGSPAELGINVISPLNENAENSQAVSLESMNSDDLFILLGNDANFIKDLQLLKKTEKYVRQNSRDGMDSTKSIIIQAKGTQNRERFKAIKQRAEKLISDAEFIVRGHELSLSGEDPKTKMQNAFQDLVDKVYSNLSLLRGHQYTEGDIAKFYTDANEGILGDQEMPLTEAQQNIIDFIQSQVRLSLRVTLKSIEEKFERKNFGWPSSAVAANVASLCGLGKIEARQNANILEGESLIAALKSNRDHENIIFDVQTEYSQSQVRALKEFIGDFFSAPPSAADAKGLAREAAEGFVQLSAQLDAQISQKERYPFVTQLEAINRTYQGLTNKNVDWFILELPALSEEISETKEQIVDPIKKFFDGSQRTIFDEVRTYIDNNKPNFDAAGSELAKNIQEILADASCFKGNKMQTVSSKHSELVSVVTEKLNEATSAAKSQFDALQNQLHSSNDYASADESKQSTADSQFEQAKSDLDAQTFIPIVNSKFNSFKDNVYPSIILNLQHSGDGDILVIRENIISARNVYVAPSKAILETETDVDAYTEELKAALKKEIRLGKRIST